MRQSDKFMKGQGLAEYGLILVLVAVAVVATLTLIGPQVGNVFSQVLSVVPQQQSGGSSGGSGGPPECYGSLLLPLLVGMMGLMVLVTHWMSKLRPDALPIRYS